MAASKPNASRHRRTFSDAAGNAHRAAALELRDLPHARADGSCCGGDHDGLAGLRLTDLEQPEVGGDAVQPQHAQRCGQGQIRVGDLAIDGLRIHRRVVLPAEPSGDQVARAGSRDVSTSPRGRRRASASLRRWRQAPSSWRPRSPSRASRAPRTGRCCAPAPVRPAAAGRGRRRSRNGSRRGCPWAGLSGGPGDSCWDVVTSSGLRKRIAGHARSALAAGHATAVLGTEHHLGLDGERQPGGADLVRLRPIHSNRRSAMRLPSK